MMDVKAAEDGLKLYSSSLAKLKAARKAIAPNSPAGVAAIDEAVAEHEAAALQLAEEIAATDWWQQVDIPALAGLIPEMAAIVGVTEGGPVERLAVRVGRLSMPYERRVDHAA